MSYASKTVTKAADLAIQKEQKLNDFCQQSLGEIKNPRVKYLLQYLADYEKKHITQLELFKKKIYEEELTTPGRDEEAPEELERSNAKIIELLNLSTEAEKKALEAFSKLQYHIDDNEWKKAFSKLVQDEHLQNRMLFDEFYDKNNQKGVYHWGD